MELLVFGAVASLLFLFAVLFQAWAISFGLRALDLDGGKPTFLRAAVVVLGLAPVAFGARLLATLVAEAVGFAGNVSVGLTIAVLTMTVPQLVAFRWAFSLRTLDALALLVVVNVSVVALGLGLYLVALVHPLLAAAVGLALALSALQSRARRDALERRLRAVR